MPSSTPASPGSPTSPAELTVERDGVPLAVRDHGGAGTPLLLLHGASRTLADWSVAAADLATDHRVVSMDLRAHGRSGPGSTPWAFPAVLDDIEAVLDACGIQEAVPVGHSLGGMAAALYADAHPHTPAAVNLDGVGHGRPEQYVGLDRDTVVQGLDRAHQFSAAAMGRTFPPEELETTVLAQQTAMAQALGIAPEVLDEGIRRALGETPEGQLYPRPERERGLEMLDQMDALDLFPVYRRLTRPVLIVRAGRLVAQGGPLAWFDELMAAYVKGLDRDLGELAAAHPHITLETLDASHAMLLERPNAVAGLIRSFTTGTAGLRSRS
ncbi:alpha/beta fold hydrolase [Streptomyces milbemycinicus]|uniref:alpha/beta fold hydrolase n=1 Tax=Streptomyces milbemycinicus TaxID=476552 RepID=UPI0033FF8194